MTTTQRFRRFSASCTLGTLLLAGGASCAMLTTASVAQAQKPQTRTLDGTVTEGNAPVKGAVVHLKDTRTLAQKSYITAEDGTYRFAALSGTSDYEVWAEVNGKKSSTKTISSFDTKSAFTVHLKLD